MGIIPPSTEIYMIEASAILKGNGLQIEAEYQERLDDLLRICHAQLKTVDEELIIQAFRLGYWAHRNDLRASGELYIAHPLEVSKIYVEGIGFDDVGRSSGSIARCGGRHRPVARVYTRNLRGVACLDY